VYFSDTVCIFYRPVYETICIKYNNNNNNARSFGKK
jgi:hypothetical protein